jgi:hypothetical protein
MIAKIKRIIKIGVLLTVLLTVTTGSVSACTGFSYSNNGTTFAAHNEDWRDYNFNIRFFPPTEGKFGRMFLEVPITLEDGNTYMAPFSGMNDQGVVFNGYATPYLKPDNYSDKPFFYDPDSYYKYWPMEHCIAVSSTVDEFLDVACSYNLEGMADFQILIADSYGTSAILEGDDIIYKEGNFQVVSNFLQSHPELGGLGTAFERYATASSMLENMTEPSIEYFRDICNATHQERSTSWTVHSMIFDLANQIIYFYHFYDYEKLVVIDLKKELEKDDHYYFVGSLFESEDNQAPDKPDAPIGEESGTIEENYKFTCRKTSDPEEHKISYMWDWGDGTFSHWMPSHTGIGNVISGTHNWTKRGSYEVRVKARDVYGAESDWSDPAIISIPKNKILNINPLIIQFLENHPYLLPILRQIILFLG